MLLAKIVIYYYIAVREVMVDITDFMRFEKF